MKYLHYKAITEYITIRVVKNLKYIQTYLIKLFIQTFFLITYITELGGECGDRSWESFRVHVCGSTRLQQTQKWDWKKWLVLIYL